MLQTMLNKYKLCYPVYSFHYFSALNSQSEYNHQTGMTPPCQQALYFIAQVPFELVCGARDPSQWVSHKLLNNTVSRALPDQRSWLVLDCTCWLFSIAVTYWAPQSTHNRPFLPGRLPGWFVFQSVGPYSCQFICMLWKNLAGTKGLMNLCSHYRH